MALPIASILDESRDYYRQLKRELVGQLLINPRGSIHLVNVQGKAYVSIRQTIAGKRTERYLGQAESEIVSDLTAQLSDYKSRLTSLREVKKAMLVLHMPQEDIRSEDFTPIIKEIFSAFEQQGLWDNGLQLIGSWCFKVYQTCCGVEFYPERTLDVDFAVTIPYSGQPTDISAFLKNFGFTEDFNHDDSIRYKSSSIIVEFLVNPKGDGRKQAEANQAANLGIAPVAIPYLNILLNNPMTITSRDIGRVTVPCLPAFMLHKLLVAGVRTGSDKKAKADKDVRQAVAVAKVVLQDAAMLDEARRIHLDLHAKWRDKIRKFTSQQISQTPNQVLRTLSEKVLNASASS